MQHTGAALRMVVSRGGLAALGTSGFLAGMIDALSSDQKREYVFVLVPCFVLAGHEANTDLSVAVTLISRDYSDFKTLEQ